MIVKQEDLQTILDKLKAENKKIVFTNGCFDIIHAGHVTYLNEAKKAGDILFLGLNTDESVRKLKGNDRPVNNENDRAFVIDNLKPIDFVILFGEDTPISLIEKIKPDVLVKGGDYTNENIVGANYVITNGGLVLIIPFVEGKSTTSLLEKIKTL